ncbi:hypothetical protein [Schumannella sp. 10F1B-5-1]|uniref:hypothetical protein n=1 Tax=Schumannella sp. 10F1B-5-1 TaxID=2590780 RepID=UPI001131D1D0|nr:hypothetical protein [Schumannella sp. 10F1B-5-1]
MPTRRTLGTVALSSLGTAAVSFAVVDVTTSIRRGCAYAVTEACRHEAVPVAAIVFTVIGFVCVAIGIVPAVLWVAHSIRAAHEQPEDDDAVADEHRRALRDPDDPVLTDDLDLTGESFDDDGSRPGRGGLRSFLFGGDRW